MKGLAYKELKQNWPIIVLMAIAPGLIAFAGGSWFLKYVGIPDANGNLRKIPFMEGIRDEQGVEMWICFIVMGLICAALMQGTVFNADARKSWVMWAAASPEGIKGSIRVKYELTLALVMLTMFSFQLGDYVMAMICAAYDTMWFGFGGIIIMLFYFQLLMRAIEIPLIIRFGVKVASLVKCSGMMILAFAAMMIFSFYGEQIIEAMTGGVPMAKGMIVRYAIALQPIVSLGAFYLSYKISCKIFMKGAWNYD